MKLDNKTILKPRSQAMWPGNEAKYWWPQSHTTSKLLSQAWEHNLLLEVMHVSPPPPHHQAFSSSKFCHSFCIAGRAWYLFSHDAIGNFQNKQAAFCILFQLTTRSTLSVYDNHPPLARYVR